MFASGFRAAERQTQIHQQQQKRIFDLNLKINKYNLCMSLFHKLFFYF